MVPIALLYVKNWEEECCKQKKEEFREQFRESIQTLSAILKSGILWKTQSGKRGKKSAPFTRKKQEL